MAKQSVEKQLKQIHKQIQKQSKAGLNKVLQEGVSIAKKYMEDAWFASYEPMTYDRTGETLKAFEIDCDIVGNKIVGTISIPNTSHKNKSPYFDEVRTFSDIHDWFAEGKATGRYGKRMDAMEHTNTKLIIMRKAISIIEAHLRKAGFNVSLSGRAETKMEEGYYEF